MDSIRIKEERSLIKRIPRFFLSFGVKLLSINTARIERVHRTRSLIVSSFRGNESSSEILKNWDIGVFPHFSSLSPLSTLKYVFIVGEYTARELVNSLSSQMEWKYYLSIKKNREKSTFTLASLIIPRRQNSKIIASTKIICIVLCICMQR